MSDAESLGAQDRIPHGPTETWTIFVCLSCGERVSDEAVYRPLRREYVHGHYHDRPDDWAESEPDPWFDATEVLVARPGGEHG